MIIHKFLAQWLVSIIIIVVAAFGAYFIVKSSTSNAEKSRQQKLEFVHNRAINQFSNSVYKFAGLVMGMRSYINHSKDLPSAEEFQSFIRRQLKEINYRDSIVVSFIDTAHVFRYAFSRSAMDPSGLVGQSVTSFRDKAEINRLNHLMQSEEIRLFYPINTIEGWVGVPMNFGVFREGKTLGYVAPLINFKSIVQSLYDDGTHNEFVFRFSTDLGYDFDRERVYDGSESYNRLVDNEYYANFDIDSAQFIYSNLLLYGLDIKIGTAYKSKFKADTNFLFIILGWYISFVLFIILITWQVNKHRGLSHQIKNVNNQLLQRQSEIDIKNEKLIQLNETKNSFFSLIGHDVKGPLNAIQGLLFLLQHEKIDNPDLEKLIEKLRESTMNTVNLLQNLLRWASSQTGDINFNKTNFEVSRIIKEEVDLLKHQAEEKNINIQTELTNDVFIAADMDMIRTVVRNIISNAIKFTPEGGEVKVKMSKNSEGMNIIIEDNGIGISDTHKLFSLEKHSTTKGTNGELGTGLGLLLCNEFVSRHNGSIHVESEVGTGTIFSIHLPIN